LGVACKHTECGPTVLSKEACDIISNTLSSSEDEDLVILVLHDLLEMLGHSITLFKLGNDLNNLSDSVVSRQLQGTNVNLDEVLQVVRRKSTDFLGPGSGPHASLSVRANLAKDLTDLGLKTHIQHTISLVENKVGNTAKVGLSGLDHINETARGSNANLNTSSKVTDLSTLGDTSVNTSVADAGRFAKLSDLLLNLNRKLTGRGEDQDDGAITRSKEGLGVDVDDGWKTVGEGLSRSSLSNTNDITTRESHGPTLGLNGGGCRETLGLDLVHDIGGEASLVEGLDWARDITALDGHLVLSTELGNFRLGSGCDLGVLLVKGFLELWESRDI
jgi:hypothetical protein